MPVSERLEMELSADLAAYVHARAREDGSTTDSDMVRDAAQRDRLHARLLGSGRRSLHVGARR